MHPPRAKVNRCPVVLLPRLADGQPIGLTQEVQLALVAAEDVPADRKVVPVGNAKRPRWLIYAASFAAVVVFGVVVASLLRMQAEPLPAAPIQQQARAPDLAPAYAALQNMGLDGLEIRQAGDRLSVSGVVADAGQYQRVLAELAPLGPYAQADVRLGSDIAADVREVFRMSGHLVQTRYTEGGRVEVRSASAEQQQLQAVAQSRAVVDIPGLVGLALMGQPDSAGAQAPKQIMAKIRGSDPHVLLADGSRYFLGATLPDGSRLVSITADDVLIEDPSGVRPWKESR